MHAYERLNIAEKLNVTGLTIVLTNSDLPRKSSQESLEIILAQKTSFVIYLTEKIELEICIREVARELLPTTLH